MSRILLLKGVPRKNDPRAMAEFYAGLARHTTIDRRDIEVAYLIEEPLPKDRKPKPDEIAETLPRMFDLVEAAEGLVVTCGALATNAVMGKVDMAHVHGIPHKVTIAGRDITVFPMYDPAAGLGNKGFLASLAYDLRALEAFVNDDLYPWGAFPRPHWTKPLLAPLGGSQDRPGGIVGLDREGFDGDQQSVQFCFDGVTGWVVYREQTELLAWLNEYLQNKRVFLHNGIGDLPGLKELGIHLTAFEDTQLLAYHHILRTGSGVLEAGSQGLAAQAYRMCEMKKGVLEDIPGVDLKAKKLPRSAAMEAYSGLDAVIQYRLAVALWNWAENTPGILDVYRIDQGQVFLIREMMDHGMPFDFDATTDYYLEALDKESRVRTELEAMAAKRGVLDFNPASPPQVRALLTGRYGLRIRKRTPTGLASTNEKALATHAAHPFVAKLQEHREMMKLIGTYLEPLIETLGGS